MSFLVKIEFITKGLFARYTNITTKLLWKLFTKVINNNEEAWVCIDRQNIKQRRASSFI
jgi:hypothetical protein